MAKTTTELLEEIHNLQGADELISLCDDIYQKAERIMEEGNLDSFLSMNYIFAGNPGNGFDNVVKLFAAFLVSVFHLEERKEDEEKEEPDFVYRVVQNQPVPTVEKVSKSQIELGDDFPTWKGLQTRVIVKLDPVRSGNGFVPMEKPPFLEAKTLFSTVDLIKQEANLETTQMDEFLAMSAKKDSKSILIFHVPSKENGSYPVFERTIRKAFAVKTINFTIPSDDEFISMCREIILEKNPNTGITGQDIKAEIARMREKNLFAGKESLDIIAETLTFNEIFGADEERGLSKSDRFSELLTKYQELGGKLKKVVIGQDHVINEVCSGLFSSEMGNAEQKRNAPKASFLFIGSPGVGKTLIAKTLGEILDLPTLVLNMSDYAVEKSYIDLVGVSKKFRNPSEGSLVRFVRQNPKCIVVFDEIEKAHIECIHLFLQILDMGRLLNAYTDKYVDFSNVIICFTSNVGKEIYNDERRQDLSAIPKRVLLDAIENEKKPDSRDPFFPQAICSRMMAGNILMFNRMDAYTLLMIVRSSIGRTVKEFEENYGIEMEVCDEMYPLFMYREGNKIDARVASKKSVDFIKNEIYEISRLMKDSPSLIENVKKIRFEICDGDKEIMSLLDPKLGECRILYIGETLYDGIQDESVNVQCVRNREELALELEKDYAYILIDPFWGYEKPKQEKLCANDIESDGMDIFRDLIDKELGLPIYILDRGNRFSDTDRESFILDGASGCIPAGESSSFFWNCAMSVAKRHYLADLHADFCNRGYCLEFSTRQIVSGDELIIQIYDLKKQTAIDSKSSKLMVSALERPAIKLNDVIGATEAKEELRYFVNFLKEPKKMLAEGVRAPKGLLLYGKPGTGKTMLAKALAGETDAAFISTNASEFLSAYRGVGEEKIREMFAVARRYAPTILFIDEIDAIGKVRTGQSSDQEVEALLNTLLVEMDGFKSNSNKPVFVLAATNFGVQGDRDKKIRLDPALLRRFDNQIYIDLPKEAERIQYLRMLRDKNSSAEFSDEAIENVAKRSIGKSIADLQNIYLLAERNASKVKGKVTDEILLDAYEQFLFGLKKEQKEEYYKSTAIHEAGHAYIAHISGNTPAYITITGRADFAGYVAPAVDEDKGNYTEKEYRWMIREKLAGRVAEKVFMGEEESMNTGAQSDLAQATRLAIDMVIRLGFVKGQMITLSYSYTDRFGIPREYLDMANDVILEELQQCETLIVEGKERIRQLADAVLEKNNLTTSQIREVLDGADS